MEIIEKNSLEYKKNAEYITNDLKRELSNTLKVVALIGSASSDRIVTNWSDIDFIIVVNKIDSNVIEKIKSVVNNRSIKIGCTIYSTNDISYKLLDSKSYYYFFLLQKGILNYYYKSEDFKIDVINENELNNAICAILLNNMHVCKRNLLYDTWDISICKSQFKIIYASMKCMLILNGVYALNYKETFEKFCGMFQFEQLDYLDVIKSINGNFVDITNLKEYSLKFIDIVSNNFGKMRRKI